MTKELGLLAMPLISENIRLICLPDSENHLEKTDWQLTETRLTNAAEPVKPGSLIASFCARALHRLVLPQPGGPWNNTILETQQMTGHQVKYFCRSKRL